MAAERLEFTAKTCDAPPSIATPAHARDGEIDLALGGMAFAFSAKREKSTVANRLVQERSSVFLLLSFEGPDPYSRAGGLGSRVSGLASALAEEGYETHLFYVGAPDLPGHELGCDGKLHLHRWCQ